MRTILFVMLFVFVSSQIIMVQPSIAQTMPGNYTLQGMNQTVSGNDTQQGMNQTISGGNAGQAAPFGNYTEMYGMNSNGNMTGGYTMHHFGNMTGGFGMHNPCMSFGGYGGYAMHHNHYGQFGNMTGGYMNGGYMMHHFGNMTGNYGMNPNGNMTASSMPQSVQSPEQQISSGVAPTNVSCPSGYGLVLNSFDSRPACISSSDISQFVARGWGHLSSP